MARTELIGTIILISVSLLIFGAIAGNAVIQASNTTALSDAGVPASTIAIYALVALIALVAIVMCYLKVGTGGRFVGARLPVFVSVITYAGYPLRCFRIFVRRIKDEFWE